MSASKVSVPSAEILKSLSTLVEIHERVLDSQYFGKVQKVQNEDVREVLLDIALRTAHQSNELMDVLARWRQKVGPAPAPAQKAPPSPTLREIVESWIEIKAGSAEIYRHAAEFAPTRELSEALLALAAEDEKLLQELRNLL